MSGHRSLMRARDCIREALIDEAQKRRTHDDWIERERDAMAFAANRYAQAHGLTSVTAADIERIEGLAVGHVDYSDKIALYVAEIVHDLRPR